MLSVFVNEVSPEAPGPIQRHEKQEEEAVLVGKAVTNNGLGTNEAINLVPPKPNIGPLFSDGHPVVPNLVRSCLYSFEVASVKREASGAGDLDSLLAMTVKVVPAMLPGG